MTAGFNSSSAGATNHVHAKEAVGHADSADQFGLKRGREQALQHDWINSEIDEDPSIDHASYHR